MSKYPKTAIEAIEAELRAAEYRVKFLKISRTALMLASEKGPTPGEVMSDGTVYVGISKSDGRPMYAMPHDIEGRHSFDSPHNSAKMTAWEQRFGGHRNWRVPTIAELEQLYQVKDLIGGFADNHYWSSTQYKFNIMAGWCLNFRNGDQLTKEGRYHNSLRCVRSG